MVTPGEFERVRNNHHHSKNPEIRAAVRSMKSMVVGEGVKVKVFGTFRDIDKKRKAAFQVAVQLNMPIETMTVNGYLYIRRIKAWK
jgi:hypothetical protein